MNFFLSENSFFLIAGPCALESEENAMYLASEIKKITDRLNIKYCFKASWDKANRTSATKYRGLGMEESMRIFKKVKKEVGVCIATDIHEAWQADKVAEFVDIIQIPAFLCRQTDLIECQTAHCGRGKPHFDFGNNISPIVRYRHLPQTLIGMTVDCCSLV